MDLKNPRVKDKLGARNWGVTKKLNRGEESAMRTYHENQRRGGEWGCQKQQLLGEKTVREKGITDLRPKKRRGG